MEDLAKDLTTVKALQRKHKGIERELAPIKDKVVQVSQLGKDVIDGFPAEKEKIEGMIRDIQEKWEMLENKAMDRSKRLEDAVGMQLFNSGVKTLLQWVDDTKNALNTNENVRDVQTAEELLNKHAEIGDEIRAKQDEFNSLIQLGQKMYGRQPSQDMEEKVNNLAEERKAVLRGWQEKGDFLRQVRDLQLFNREADRLDATTSAQVKLLDSIGVGDNLPDVEGSLKRHEDFTATIGAQEERINAFKDLAIQLTDAGHHNRDNIHQRRDKVLAGRENLKQKSVEKRTDLDESKIFQEFRTEVGEMLNFVHDKKKLVHDDSFKDGIGNIKAKAKKYQVLEGEMKSNTAQLKVLNRTGQQMINRNHFKSKDIGNELANLNRSWDELMEAAKDQGSRLGQAESQMEYNRMTGDIKTKLADVRSTINTEETGVDIRGCKKLLSQHAAAEAELAALEQKVGSLGQVASDLADGHFDGDSILENCEDLKQELAKLKLPTDKRKSALNLSLKFHEFNFDLQRELEWIAEKITIISAPQDIQTLPQAQSSDKKHKKLEEEVKNHSVVVDKVMKSGANLASSPEHAKDVMDNSKKLTEAWDNLLEAIQIKASQLKLILTAQQFFFEVVEVEGWIKDKSESMKQGDYGKEEDSSVKLLTKHKALELEIDTYSGIVKEISATSNKLTNSNHPDSKKIKSRDEMLSREIKNLKNLSKARRDRLVGAIQAHEYKRESEDFLAWIGK